MELFPMVPATDPIFDHSEQLVSRHQLFFGFLNNGLNGT